MSSQSTRSSTRKAKDLDGPSEDGRLLPAKRSKTTHTFDDTVTAKAAGTDGEKKLTMDEGSASVVKGQSIAGEGSKGTGSSTRTTLKVEESEGDIFSAPSHTLIIHACNCEGSWGAGIAAAFRKTYPRAFDMYVDHCDKNGSKLVGKAFLISPVETDPGKPDKHFVGCLFTSKSKGKKVDPPAKILKATGPAMEDLLKQVQAWNEKNPNDAVAEVRMCKINSGLFRVPWEKTRRELEKIDVGALDVKTVCVVSLPGS